jgi:hypothetical protein
VINIDTHKIYTDLIANGLTNEQALAHLKSYENIGNSLLNWLREAREEFASQKLISILGTLILLVGAASIGLMWNLSVDMKILQNDMRILQNDMSNIKTVCEVKDSSSKQKV